MTPVWADNAATTLAFPISDTATSCTLLSGSGAEFPDPAPGFVFSLTFISASNPNLFEIAYCTARVGDVCFITRGQEGTAALAWNAGDFARNYVTSGLLNLAFQQAVGGVLTGTLPNPGMAAGAASTNIGALGGALAGTLPNPTIANSVSLPGSPTTTTQTSGTANATVANTSFVNPNSHVSATGHRVFPDGLIMQWGMGAAPSGSPPLSVIVNFDIVFPNAVFALTLGGETDNPPGIGYTGLSVSGATLWTNGGGGENITYIALGW